MAGPWENYQQAPSGPWTKFAAAPAAPEAPQYSPTEEADIPYQNRFVVKNFAANPEAGVAYLKQKLPNMDFSVHNGEIFARKPGEKAYKALDPDTGFFSKDFLKDTGDIAYDLGKGAVLSAATGLGGMAGGLPGSMAAGGATGAGLEALRQKIGQYLGVPQEIDPSQVKSEAAFGALAGPIEKGAKLAGGFVKNSVLPKIGQMTSGVPAKVLNDYAANADRVKYLAEHPEELTNLVKNAKDQIISGVTNKVQQTGKAIGDVVDRATQEGKLVDISGLKQALEKRIADAERRAVDGGNTPDSLRPLENLQSIKENFFTSGEGQEIPNVVTPSAAFDLKQRLKTIAQPDLGPRAVNRIKDPADKEAMRFGKEAMDKVTQELNKVSPDELAPLNKNYQHLSEIADNVTKKVATDEKAENVFRNLDSPAKRTLQRQLQQTLSPEEATKLKDTLQLLQTQSYMGDPAVNALSGLGSTSTSRTVPLQTAGAGIGSYLGYKIGNSPGSALLGGALGAKTGAALGSPKTVGAGLRLLNQGTDAVGNAPGLRPGLYGAGQSAWDALQQRILNNQENNQ